MTKIMGYHIIFIKSELQKQIASEMKQKKIRTTSNRNKLKFKIALLYMKKKNQNIFLINLCIPTVILSNIFKLNTNKYIF